MDHKSSFLDFVMKEIKELNAKAENIREIYEDFIPMEI